MKNYQNPQPHAVEKADKKGTPPSNLGASIPLSSPNAPHVKEEKSPKNKK